MSVRFKVNTGSELAAVIDASEELGATATFMQTSEPAHGQLVAFDAGGAFAYRPDRGFSGIDSFTVSASDGGNLVLATIVLEVQMPGTGRTPVSIDGAPRLSC
jgi:hypothetical protein